jgi:type IV pilus assembly protein PilM
MVEDRVACALGAGLKAWVMDVEAFAAQAAFELVETQLPSGGKDQSIAFIDVGASVMNVTMMRNDQPVYNREQAFGGSQLTQEIMRVYGMSIEEAEAAKRSGSLPDNYDKEILSPFLESLAQEVARALQFFFTSTQFTQVDHIVLAGGCATLPRVSEAVFSHTQVDTIIANPFTKMSMSTRVKERSLLADAPSLMIACGLALRRFDQ